MPVIPQVTAASALFYQALHRSDPSYRIPLEDAFQNVEEGVIPLCADSKVTRDMGGYFVRATDNCTTVKRRTANNSTNSKGEIVLTTVLQIVLQIYLPLVLVVLC